MDAPKPKPIAIREVNWNNNGQIRLHIWTTTKEAHNWVAEEAPQFGTYEEAARPSRKRGCEEDSWDYHVLILAPVYVLAEVIAYLSEIPAE